MSDESENNELPKIKDVFELLDRWRHLPAYRLEFRVDIFFALFLPDVLEEILSEGNSKVKIRRPLIPEFPIRTNKNGEGDYNLSRKVDYLAISEDGERSFLIELKTDEKSMSKDQIIFLQETAIGGMAQVIDGLKKIAGCDSVQKKSYTRRKYYHLFHELEECGLIKMPDRSRFQKLVFGRSRLAERKKCIGDVEIGKCPRRIEVVYIQPDRATVNRRVPIPSDWHSVDFDCLIRHAKERGPIGHRFAESLCVWKEPAGSCPPLS